MHAPASLVFRPAATSRCLSAPTRRALIDAGIRATDLAAIAAAGVAAMAAQPAPASAGTAADVMIACLLAPHLFPLLDLYRDTGPASPKLLCRLLLGWIGVLGTTMAAA